MASMMSDGVLIFATDKTNIANIHELHAIYRHLKT